MKQATITKIAGAFLLVGVLAFAGCSSNTDKAKKPGVVDQVVDTFSQKLADNIIEAHHAAEVAKADSGATAVQPAVAPATEVAHVKDMILVGSKIYAIHNGGIVVYDMADKSVKNLDNGEVMNALAYHGGKIYAGGKGLYTIQGQIFEPVEFKFDGTISTLGSFDLALIVGTDRGLYSRSVFGDEQLMDDVFVTSVAIDGDGLWIGTGGQGLYRWDGVDIKKRFLARDPSLFDNINCLAFNHKHLYVGSDSGMFVYDGGRWLTLTTEDGLPSNEIRSIDAANWIVYVATASGVTSYFDGDFIPVQKLADKDVTVIRTLGNKIIAGTENDGILQKSGPSVKVLVDPNEPIDSADSKTFTVTF